MATYPKRDTHVAPPPPHHGWLAGSRKTAWKAIEPDGQKVVKVECRHTRASTGRPARAIVRGTDKFLLESYTVGLVNPCRITECGRLRRG